MKKRYTSNKNKLVQISLTAPMKGNDAFGVGLRELILNGLDAKATSIAIYFGEYDGKKALFVEDNGKGMDEKSLQHVLNFGLSHKTNDNSVTGLHGTGSKLFLGFGKDITENNLVFTSKTQAMDHTLRAETNFQHLVKGFDKNATATVIAKKTEKAWDKSIPKRNSGTTVVFTGFDGRSAWSPQKIIQEFSHGRFITPNALKKVKVLNAENIWETIPHIPFGDEELSITVEDAVLGKITYQLVLDGPGNEDLYICGKDNILISFHDMYRKLSPEEKKLIPTSARKLSGHIMIEKMKQYRDHDSSLKQTFYDEALGSFLKGFIEICEEASKRQKQIADEEHMKSHKIYARRFAAINKRVFGSYEGQRKLQIQYQDTDTMLTSNNVSDSDPNEVRAVHIIPKNKRLKTNANFTFNIVGPNDYSDAQWHIDENQLLTVDNYTGSQISGRTKDVIGKVNITVSHSSFDQPISFLVSVHADKDEESIFIKGRSSLFPDDTVLYTLVDPSNTIDISKVRWSITYIHDNKVKGLSKEAINEKVLISTTADCEIGKFYLVAKIGRKRIAKKLITVKETVGDKPLMVKVNDVPYVLQVGATYNHTAHCISGDHTDIGSIYYNPMSLLMRKSGSPIDKMLLSIASAVLARQLIDGKISNVSSFNKMLDQFVSEMKNEWFSKK